MASCSQCPTACAAAGLLAACAQVPGPSESTTRAPKPSPWTAMARASRRGSASQRSAQGQWTGQNAAITVQNRRRSSRRATPGWCIRSRRASTQTASRRTCFLLSIGTALFGRIHLDRRTRRFCDSSAPQQDMAAQFSIVFDAGGHDWRNQAAVCCLYAGSGKKAEPSNPLGSTGRPTGR